MTFLETLGRQIRARFLGMFAVVLFTSMATAEERTGERKAEPVWRAEALGASDALQALPQTLRRCSELLQGRRDRFRVGRPSGKAVRGLLQVGRESMSFLGMLEGPGFQSTDRAGPGSRRPRDCRQQSNDGSIEQGHARRDSTAQSPRADAEGEARGDMEPPSAAVTTTSRGPTPKARPRGTWSRPAERLTPRRGSGEPVRDRNHRLRRRLLRVSACLAPLRWGHRPTETYAR